MSDAIEWRKENGPTEEKIWYRKDFIWFLENTLIPDLKDSGLHSTAEDFETAVFFMKGDYVWDEDSGLEFEEFPTVRIFDRRLDI